MIKKHELLNFDVPLFVAVLVLSVIGVIIVTSASLPYTVDSFSELVQAISEMRVNYFSRQLTWVGVGVFLMLFMCTFDYRDLGRLSVLIYIVNLGLLLMVIFAGQEAMGAQRWVQIGFFRLQPSEFAKIAITITLAKYISREDVKLNNLTDLIVPGIHVGIPMLLIFLQPDLGTSLVFSAIVFSMVFAAGLKWRHILICVGTGVLGAVFAFFKVLSDYQRSRLIVFTDPEAHYLGAGFQVIQSKIAVGAGGISDGSLWGKGLFQGTQSKLNFLPEAQTDFVYSVIAEEMGMIGAVLVLFLFLFIIYRILVIAVQADTFGTYICVGIAAIMSFQLLVNVGMTLSMMPVTGIPLPFITYGGSTFLSSALGIGLVLNIGMRKEKETLF
ncbi:rod shape-determining protein RodA [Proteinivorax hydrogeniformans]|uniref:Peptidoglycan glycosyltransferase RodA n=1 Tax=Proteinivorax hydrogeniformans TaxID=1826727 RepID=A0AAU8HWN4_9FIRM